MPPYTVYHGMCLVNSLVPVFVPYFFFVGEVDGPLDPRMSELCDRVRELLVAGEWAECAQLQVQWPELLAGPHGRLLLPYFVSRGRTEPVEFLLRRGALVNAVTDGWVPLALAVQHKNQDIVLLLLRSRARVGDDMVARATHHGASGRVIEALYSARAAEFARTFLLCVQRRHPRQYDAARRHVMQCFGYDDAPDLSAPPSYWVTGPAIDRIGSATGLATGTTDAAATGHATGPTDAPALGHATGRATAPATGRADGPAVAHRQGDERAQGVGVAHTADPGTQSAQAEAGAETSAVFAGRAVSGPHYARRGVQHGITVDFVRQVTDCAWPFRMSPLQMALWNLRVPESAEVVTALLRCRANVHAPVVLSADERGGLLGLRSHMDYVIENLQRYGSGTLSLPLRQIGRMVRYAAESPGCVGGRKCLSMQAALNTRHVSCVAYFAERRRGPAFQIGLCVTGPFIPLEEALTHAEVGVLNRLMRLREVQEGGFNADCMERTAGIVRALLSRGILGMHRVVPGQPTPLEAAVRESQWLVVRTMLEFAAAPRQKTTAAIAHRAVRACELNLQCPPDVKAGVIAIEHACGGLPLKRRAPE